MRRFAKTLQVSTRTRVLDVGGSPAIWQFSPVQPRLTILNFPSALERTNSAHLVAGDGRMVPFKNGAFDIVFSNSVIEHVGKRADQQSFAEEISRVGRYYWVQTPNRGFPVELHLMLPFIHYLPKNWQFAIAKRFTVWELLVRPNQYQRAFYIDHFLNELNLLDAQELSHLFPDAKIISERVLGIAKSLIAVRA